MIERDAIIQAAHARAEQIIQQARLETESTKRDADEYVLESLSRLEVELEKMLNQVRNGVRALQSERQQAMTPTPLQTDKD
jgi:F0F1-type ATP synthase membrane subunit b/b'